MDQKKPPGPWNDGVREPRATLSAAPNQTLLNPPAKPLLDCKNLDQRAANQPFPELSDEALLLSQETTTAPPRAKHPRLKYRALLQALSEPLVPLE